MRINIAALSNKKSSEPFNNLHPKFLSSKAGNVSLGGRLVKGLYGGREQLAAN